MSRPVRLPARPITARDWLLIPRLRRAGVKMPIRAIKAARRTDLPLNVAASLLVQESGGGANVFGHDPTIYVGAGTVTKKKYLAYRKIRRESKNRLMQGVGPMQLTWWTIQDEADRRGGCWNPLVNMTVGFERAKLLIERYGWRDGVRRYNGSGMNAELYADRVLARAKAIQATLHPRWEPTAPWGSISGTHFTWGEVVARSGYANLPRSLRSGATRHAKNLERLRSRINAERQRRNLKETGIRILSWARSPEKNRAVGGAALSRHLKADATDISKEEIFRLCPWSGGRDFFEREADRVFARGGFGQYPGGNRHVDSRGFRARWTSWTPGR